MAPNKKHDRLNLQEALSKRVFHNALFTTFTFDPLFFEDFCIEKFSSLSINDNITVLVDRSTYESIISAPEAQRPKIANIRYLLHPITVPGRFHAKLFLLTTRTSGRLVFGSANLTRPGLTSNAEIADQYDFELGQDEEYRYLFCEVFEFLTKVVEWWPSTSLTSNLQQLYRSTPWLQNPPLGGTGPMRFLHNLDRSLWAQLTDAIPRPIDRVHVVSPFFDDQPGLIDRLFQDWNPSKLLIYTENGRTTLTKPWLRHHFVKSGRAEILFSTFEDDGYRQPLHAKAMVFESGKTRHAVYGSANFTSAALLSKARRGNVETLLVLPGLSKSFDVKRFVDPCENAHQLANDDALQSNEREAKVSHDSSTAVRLHEVVLESEGLILYGEFPENIPGSTVTHLEMGSSAGFDLKTTQESRERCSAKIADRLIPPLSERSCLVWLKDQTTESRLSNTLLITNLVDIETNESVTHKRQFRGAKESASQFFALLNDLLRAGDTAALLAFLSFCDIPLLNAPSITALRQRPVWGGTEGMRSLGERNLKICKTLHEATLAFFDRHLKKLQRHATTRMLDGIPNFLHIFLSMGNLLRTQVERTILGLEAKSSPVTVEEWYQCREFWNVYFDRFKTLMHCLWDDYLKRIGSEYKRNDIEREFGPDLGAVHELCDEMIRFGERVTALRVTKRINIGYFHCVLGEPRWKQYATDIQIRQQQVELVVLGKSDHSMSPAPTS